VGTFDLIDAIAYLTEQLARMQIFAENRQFLTSKGEGFVLIALQLANLGLSVA